MPTAKCQVQSGRLVSGLLIAARRPATSFRSRLHGPLRKPVHDPLHGAARSPSRQPAPQPYPTMPLRLEPVPARASAAC